jgi:hypothetical protein
MVLELVIGPEMRHTRPTRAIWGRAWVDLIKAVACGGDC